MRRVLNFTIRKEDFTTKERMYWIQCIENGPRRVNHAAGALDNFIYSFGGYSNTEDYTRVTPIDIHIFNIRKNNLLLYVFFIYLFRYIKMVFITKTSNKWSTI